MSFLTPIQVFFSGTSIKETSLLQLQVDWKKTKIQHRLRSGGQQSQKNESVQERKTSLNQWSI